MPEFSTALSGLAAKRKLSDHELVRSIRFMIAAEFEAIQMYEQLADSTDNQLARKVLADIIGEEREHVGEFRYLLTILAGEEEPDYRKGIEEAREYLSPMLKACGMHGDGNCGPHGEPDSDACRFADTGKPDSQPCPCGDSDKDGRPCPCDTGECGSCGGGDQPAE